MEKAKLSLSSNYKYYLIKRIDSDDIEISRETRDMILKAMADNARYVQVGEYTIMVNSIRSIEPSMPPKPKPQQNFDPDKGYYLTNQDEIDAWEKKYLNENNLIKL